MSHAATSRQLLRSREGRGAFFFIYPLQRTGKNFLRMRLESVEKFAGERCYIIDVKAFPGHSGSPVEERWPEGTQHAKGHADPSLQGLHSETVPLEKASFLE